MTTEAVEPVTCDEVTCVLVPDSSAAGPVLVGDVGFVGVQKSTNWLNWSFRYERSVILLLAPLLSTHVLQPLRSFVNAESEAQSSEDLPSFWASE